ncbi:hypothetical protein DL98DRAFT_111485 [Cadophora sp. DSE1049]|nr:hypothetical protein DL98DRAFT_111485 [Cadophora sp. DSE1049]
MGGWGLIIHSRGFPRVRRAYRIEGPVPKSSSCRWIVFISVWLVVLCSRSGGKDLHSQSFPRWRCNPPLAPTDSILALQTLKRAEGS